jgi:hypothetical protein
MKDDIIVFRNKKTGHRLKLRVGLEDDMIDEFRKNGEYKELMNL